MSTLTSNPASPLPVARPVLAAAVGVGKSYGGVVALRDASLTVQAGECHALIGENGAGKSTLVKVLTGVHPPNQGHIEVAGREVSLRSPLHAEQLGIHAIHQHLALVRGLSVIDNFLLGRSETVSRTTRFGLLDRPGATDVVRRALETVGLGIDPRTRVGSLSVPQAQLVQIARALTADAKVLLLDEPTASLTSADRDHLFERLNALRAEGVGLVYVSHRLDEITELCDRATVLRDGEIVRRLARDELRVDTMVEAMLDRPIQQLYPGPMAPPTEQRVLEVDRLRVGAQEVSFHVDAGEIVGLTGLVGAGMVETAEAIAGARRATSGTVRIDGQERRPRSVLDGMRHRIALVPEDRAQALVAALSISDNLALSEVSRRQLASRLALRWRWLPRRRTRRDALDAISRFAIEPGRPLARAGSLSGGNQQKIVLAKAMCTGPRVLVLIEPTAGVDVGSRAQIYEILRRLAADGAAIVLVSSDVQEIGGLSDRVLVFRRGAIGAELAGDAGEHEIMTHATTTASSAPRG